MNKKMTRITGVILKFTAATTIGCCGWYLGKYSAEKRHLNAHIGDSRTSVFSNIRIKEMPGLPLFGTVSAATAFVPAETGAGMGSKLSSTAARVSESNLANWKLTGRIEIFELWRKRLRVIGDLYLELQRFPQRTGSNFGLTEIMKYGFPGLDHVRSFDDYVLSYDRRNRVAHWVFEHLNKDRLQHNKEISRSKCDFKPDPSIHPFFRAENSDYKGSGYDRGHLAAAGNHKCDQNHIDQTFFLSNMAPQVGSGFNRDSWNRLEKYVRQLTKIYKDVYVCTGPLYLPKVEADGKSYVRYEVIGRNHVAVPTHFYKIVVAETHDSKLEMEAFVMPNAPIDDSAPLTNFRVPPESVERAAGLLFFDKISREKLSKINGKNAR